LQTQIDGSITTFFYAYVPLLTNVPANAWTTTAIKNQHLGDLFYDTSTGYSYRYQLVSTTYSWQRITDTDITTALANAATAQDTADHKRRVFVANPTTPYDIGDLWAGGSAGDLKKCSTARASGAYVSGDWTLASKYTDDTTANTGVTNAAAAQTQANLGVTNAALAQTTANNAAADALTAHNLADAAQAAAVAADAVADTAITNAATAQTAANTAQTTANTAITNAATANGLLADLASDSKLTAVEKQTVKKEWDGIVSEVALNDAQATTFGIATQKTTYDNAYSALNTYITPLLSSLTTTSDIVGTTFRSTFKTYYDALTSLLNAIADKARTNAATAQTTANTAVTNAGTAQTTANTAVTNAATAQTQANLGVTNAATAQTAATNAATVAAAKNKTFYTQPAPPYYIGDIWQKQQVPVAVTDIVKCTVTRLTGVYTAADWANACTSLEIAAMGSTIINGGHISTSLLTSPDGLTYLNLATGIFHAKDMIEALGFTGITPYCGTRATFADINFIVQLLDLYTDFYNPVLFQTTHARASYANLGTTHWTTDSDFLHIMHGMQFDVNGNVSMLPGKTLDVIPPTVSSHAASKGYVDTIKVGGLANAFSAMPYVGAAPIVESGSNANGSYVKYVDGTMICRAVTGIVFSGTNTLGPVYYGPPNTINYPQTFYSSPNVIPSVLIAGTGAPISATISSVGLSSCACCLIGAISGGNGYISIIAIGRWKV